MSSPTLEASTSYAYIGSLLSQSVKRWPIFQPPLQYEQWRYISLAMVNHRSKHEILTSVGSMLSQCSRRCGSNEQALDDHLFCRQIGDMFRCWRNDGPMALPLAQQCILPCLEGLYHQQGISQPVCSKNNTQPVRLPGWLAGRREHPHHIHHTPGWRQHLILDPAI